MRILHLTLNRQAAELIRATLGGANVSMSIASNYEQVLRLPDQNFSRVILDRLLYGTTGPEVVKRLQKAGLCLTSDFWLCGKERNSNHPDIASDMEKLTASRYFRLPLSALDIKAALHALTQVKAPNISPTALRMIGQIWASKSSVMLQVDGAEVFFGHGALVHQDPADGLMQILKDMPKVVYTDVQGKVGRRQASSTSQPCNTSVVVEPPQQAVRVSAFLISPSF